MAPSGASAGRSGTSSIGSAVNIVQPASIPASMSAIDLRWSASAPNPSRQPAASAPNVAASRTSWNDRPVRASSRADCWANTGKMPGLARNAAAWPGVAIPIRSPPPAEVAPPTSRGRSHGTSLRSAAAFPRSGLPVISVPPPSSIVSPAIPPGNGVPFGAQARTCQPSSAARIPTAPASTEKKDSSIAPACRSVPIAPPAPAPPRSAGLPAATATAPGPRRGPGRGGGSSCGPRRP